MLSNVLGDFISPHIPVATPVDEDQADPDWDEFIEFMSNQNNDPDPDTAETITLSLDNDMDVVRVSNEISLP
jgi:hypothetical protein